MNSILLWTIIGLIVAIACLLLAAHFVYHARKGNRFVREARHDPHAAHTASGEPTRDIDQ